MAAKLPKSSPAQNMRPRPDRMATRGRFLAAQPVGRRDQRVEHGRIERVELVLADHLDMGDRPVQAGLDTVMKVFDLRHVSVLCPIYARAKFRHEVRDDKT